MDEEKIQDMEKELEELRPLKDSSAKLQEEFKAKEEAWSNEKKQLEESANPNWQKARQRISSLETALKDKGVELNEDGTVKNNPQGVDIEEVRREARESARSELTGNKLANLLSQYDEESAKIVKHFFNKVSTGESVTLDNIDNFFRQAESAANYENKIQRKGVRFSGGQGPSMREPGQVDQGRVSELAKRLNIKLK